MDTAITLMDTTDLIDTMATIGLTIGTAGIAFTVITATIATN
jgi:hypothetical protein